MKQKNITAIILAAGAGKRFWPFSTNKVLFPFFGKPLINFTADMPQDVTRIVIIADPKNAGTFRTLKSSVPTTVVVQASPNGMADALLSAKKEVQSGSIMILIADDVTEVNVVEPLLHAARSTDASGLLVGWKTPTYFPGGYLMLDGTRITGVAEKPKPGSQPSSFVYISTQYFADSDALFSRIESTSSAKDDVYEKALTSLMAEKQFLMIPYTGAFASLKYPWHVLDVMNILFTKLQSHKGKNVVIKNNVVIEGPVHIEDNVKIFENTKIVGPCYIGKNTIIGNNCIIRGSHIGEDCVVGFNCDVTRSYVGNNCWFHSNYIGDSVCEENISLGAGAALANLRLDDGDIKGTGRNKLGAMIARGVRIGVNASIMPGVKIGKNSFIGSGVVLEKDLPEDSFCLAKPGYVVTKNKKTASVRNIHI